MRKKWYIIQTYSGLEYSVKEAIEAKVKAMGMEHFIGRIVIPEETIVDTTSESGEKYVLSPSARLHVSTGYEVKKGDLLAEEPSVYVKRNGVIREVKNVRKIVIETIDKKYTKTYYIPESAKVEVGIKLGTRLRQGMPLSKNQEYICELDGRVVINERMKRVLVDTEDGDQDVYYIPLESFDKDRIKKGEKVKQGQLLADGKKFYANSSGLVELVEYSMRKEIRIMKTKKRRLFPGYIFIEMFMNEETWNLVRTVPNVINFVSSGGQPIPLKPLEVRAVLRQAGIEEYEKVGRKAVKLEIGYNVGEIVRIKSGPFEDFVGTISEINLERQELKVMVSIFGRETPIVLHVSEVEKIG